ncbi:Na+/H+ antiporter subunit E [Oceanobacillus massiliensis]|uniref:Na+/H+ antiporter subunit E n=1 Tax=Oceanobacillus massiliensis TaxID=1465765 RepID=UPI000288F9E6|nr:Na+/H+ antiporter subunit E [Oceanobacillus massiliensis]
MPFQIVINLTVAIMWMFLSESYTMPSFITGFIFGILLLLLLRRFLPGGFYLKRVFKAFKLLFIFIREMILSNIDMIKYIYSPQPIKEPGIFEYPIELKRDWEITLLANLISLTPGTLSIAISDDKSKLYIHAMHIDDVEIEIKSIKDTFEKTIMEVTR